MPAEDLRPTPGRVVTDHDAEAGFADTLDLDSCEGVGSLTGQGRTEYLPLGRDVIAERPQSVRRPHQHEVPRLGHADRRGGVGSQQHPVQRLRRDRLAGELSPGVAAAMDDVIEPACHGMPDRSRAGS